MPEAPNNAQTIMFADISGSTRLYEKLGDIPARAIVSHCIVQMARVAEKHQGQVVKTLGDEVMCCFDTPDMAAKAAIDMQEVVVSNARLSVENVRIRIGIHHGQVIRESEDLHGDAVNVAAGMVEQAKAGQIIASRHALDMMSPDLVSLSRIVDRTRVKGKQQAIEIFELSWGCPDEMTRVNACTDDMLKSVSFRDALLTLDMQDQHVSVNDDQPLITMGRGATNRIVVNYPKVSRIHARIEMRKNKFIITDQSTNGTYILADKEEPTLLRRDEFSLAGEGVIYLGKKTSPDSPYAIHYHVI